MRHPGEKFVIRHEDDWPIPRTQWTKFHLDERCAQAGAAKPPKAKRERDLRRLGDGVTFLTEPLTEATEITGPIAAKLHVSSSTEDADFFLVLRVFSPDMKEVTFQGALDPHTPIAQGWLRASHRKLDKKLSLPLPALAHRMTRSSRSSPGEVYELDIEIHPTCIVVPKGYRVALTRARQATTSIRAASGGKLSNMKNEFTGVGPFLHDDPRDRPVKIYGGKTTLHLGGGRENFVLLPIIPPKPETKPAGSRGRSRR